MHLLVRLLSNLFVSLFSLLTILHYLHVFTALLAFGHAICIFQTNGVYTMVDTIANNPFGVPAFIASCNTAQEMCIMLTEYFNVKKNGPSGPSSPWEAVIMKRKAQQGKSFGVYV